MRKIYTDFQLYFTINTIRGGWEGGGGESRGGGGDELKLIGIGGDCIEIICRRLN